MKPARSALVAVAGLAGFVPAIAAAEGMYPDRPDLFPIGVWQQATFNFDSWKSRGINTLVQVPGGHDRQRRYWSDWHNQAVQKGFEIIRKPDPNLKLDRDLQRPNLRALSLVDEPDYNDYPVSTLQADYNRIKSAAPDMPVFVNYSGGVVLDAQRTRGGVPASQVPYGSYMNATDWVSSSIYPVTGWNRPDWIDYSITGDKKNPGKAIDQLRTFAPAKPQWAVIETSDQNLSWIPDAPGVNAAQFRGQLWHSIVHGARGVIYFPLELGRDFHFDATPADVVNEMQVQHPRIQQIAAALNENWNPAGTRGYTDPAEDLGFSSADARIEGSWHHSADGDYFVVLNMSSVPGEYEFTLTGADGTAQVVGENRFVSTSGDLLSDSFGAWETHIYRFSDVAAPGALNILAVPEPSSMGLLIGAALLGFRRMRRPNRACSAS